MSIVIRECRRISEIIFLQEKLLDARKQRQRIIFLIWFDGKDGKAEGNARFV